MAIDPERFSALTNALQVVAPLAQRLAVTSKQQEQDAAALLEATERAVTLVRAMRPGDSREKGGV